MAIGLFDRYCSAEVMMNNPILYKDSQGGHRFNMWVSFTCKACLGHWPLSSSAYLVLNLWPHGMPLGFILCIQYRMYHNIIEEHKIVISGNFLALS